MPDITMCIGDGCPIKERCYRFTASPDKHQSYFVEPPIVFEDNIAHCGYYWGEDAQNIYNHLTDILNEKHPDNEEKS